MGKSVIGTYSLHIKDIHMISPSEEQTKGAESG